MKLVSTAAFTLLACLAAPQLVAQCTANCADWNASNGSTTTTDKVGIGTTSPVILNGDTGGIHVSSAYPAIRLTATGSGRDFQLQTGSDGQLALADTTGGTNNTRLFITAAGNVSFASTLGIGTQTPAVLNGNTTGLQLASSYPAIRLTATGANGHDYQIQTGSDGQLAIADVTNATNNSRLYIDAAGNVSIGQAPLAANLNVTGTITATNGIKATYQDVAEWVPTTKALPVASVVVLDPVNANHVVMSHAAYDTTVAGVVSATPGIVLGQAGEAKAMIATTGRVRVRVDATRAPIAIGDLLVTSDEEGMAMKSQPIEMNGRRFHQPGTIIGKALEPLAGGKGEILVLLSLQ